MPGVKPTGEYPPNWDEIARQVKDATDWRCERCDHVSVYRHMLTVHHLDGNKSNNHPANLAALCQSCHLHVQCTFDPSEMLLPLESIDGIEEDWKRNRRALYQQTREEM